MWYPTAFVSTPVVREVVVPIREEESDIFIPLSKKRPLFALPVKEVAKDDNWLSADNALLNM